MELIGKLSNISIDFETGNPIVGFQAEDKGILQHIENLKDKRLRIEVKEYREKRSLDANNYLHVLLSKLADAMRISKPKCKNLMLRSYGQYDTYDGKMIQVILADEQSDMVDEYEYYHLAPTSHATTMANGKVYRMYYKLKGSHELDSKEFSVLLDGVIYECQNVGIETATPEQIAKMKALLGEKDEERTGD